MYWLVLFAVPWIVVAGWPGVTSSRRVLAVMLVVVVPIVGPLLAILVRRVRGGQVPLEPTRSRPRHGPSPADVRRLGDLPPVLERLMTGGATERLAALVHLASVGDAAAVEVLRWVVEHAGPEVVLEAALTLEELDLRLAAATIVVATPPVPTLDDAPQAAAHDERQRAVRASVRDTNARVLAVHDLVGRDRAVVHDLGARDLAVQ